MHARRRAQRNSLATGALTPDMREERALGVHDECLASRRQALLQELIDELPEPQAETLALRVVVGLSLKETAAATGAPVNTVRSRMRLAREALRTRIEQQPALAELLGGEL